MFEDLGGGSASVTVRTFTSGRRPGSTIYFLLNLTQLTAGDNGRPINSPSTIRMDVPDYNNGDNVVFTLDDNLVIGAVYIIEVYVGNEFGMSRGSSSVNGVVVGMEHVVVIMYSLLMVDTNSEFCCYSFF